MHRRLAKRVLASIGVVAFAAAGLTLVVPAAEARKAAPIRFVHRVAPYGVRAGHAAPRAFAPRAAAAGAAGAASDAAFYRAHLHEGQEPEGGEAVHLGEAPAPKTGGSAPVSSSAPGLTASWQGSNHFDSRYSGNGNQFNGEPPDQGLCASNGREFEIVNSVIQVYTRNGTPLIAGNPFFAGTAPVGETLNEFFGLPPEFVRPAGPFASELFDISCKYDRATQRWFVLVEFLELDPVTSAFTGPGGFYLAVSTSRSPLGAFNIYQVDTTNNGTNGTPDHQCSSGFCIGDFPQLGLDRNGVYITTNEFDFLGAGEFHAAQLYAFSKADLVSGSTTPKMQYIPDVFSDAVGAGSYSLEPVDSLASDREDANGGTMYFGMSQSPFFDTFASAVSLWRLTNTSSLDSSPDLQLTETSIPTGDYATPPQAQQKEGPTPLLRCENDVACIGVDNPEQESPLPLDSGPGKVSGAWLHDGVVYLVAGAALEGKGGAVFSPDGITWEKVPVHAGVVYVALEPSTTTDDVTRLFQGSFDVKGQNLLYPTIALNADGQGAVGVALAGPKYYPSAAYMPFSTNGPSGDLQIAGAGVGPNDGFTGTADGGYRTRWGDYGATAVSSNGTVWMATEYIAQSCGFKEWLADSTCGFTRAFLANWSTRVFAITP